MSVCGLSLGNTRGNLSCFYLDWLINPNFYLNLRQIIRYVLDMNQSQIIGRKNELERLFRLYNSDKSEFVAIYGRRRVGKSFLVDEAFRIFGFA